MWRRCVAKLQRYPRHALGSLNPQSVPFVTRSVTGGIPTRSMGTISVEADSGITLSTGMGMIGVLEITLIVPTLCVGMPLRTLRVRSGMWRRCAPKLQRYPRHALGSLNPQSVPCVTRSVTGGMPTRSMGTISVEADLCVTTSAAAWGTHPGPVRKPAPPATPVRPESVVRRSSWLPANRRPIRRESTLPGGR